MISEEYEQDFYATVKSNIDAWQVENAEYLAPIRWLVQKGYEFFLINSDVFDIGVDANPGMPNRIAMVYHRPPPLKCRIHQMASAFPRWGVSEPHFGRTVVTGMLPTRRFKKDEFRLIVRPYTSYWWKKIGIEPSLDYMWFLALLRNHTMSYQLFKKDALVQYDDTASAANCTSERILELCSWKKTKNISPPMREFLEAYVPSFFKDHPDWSIGPRLERFLAEEVVSAAEMFGEVKKPRRLS